MTERVFLKCQDRLKHGDEPYICFYARNVPIIVSEANTYAFRCLLFSKTGFFYLITGATTYHPTFEIGVQDSTHTPSDKYG